MRQIILQSKRLSIQLMLDIEPRNLQSDIDFEHHERRLQFCLEIGYHPTHLLARLLQFQRDVVAWCVVVDLSLA